MSETSDYWIDMYDYLGTDPPTGNPRMVKKLLKSLLKDNALTKMDEIVLYTFLFRNGYLSTTDRHKDFFQDLLRASRDKQGLKKIEGYAENDSQIPPDIGNYGFNPYISEDDEQSIKTAKIDELGSESDEIFESESFQDPEEIFNNADLFANFQKTILGKQESLSVDDEAMQFYISYSVKDLWRNVYSSEDTRKIINKAKSKTKSKSLYQKVVAKKFLTEINGALNYPVPKNFEFKHDLFLMQRHLAYMMSTVPFFGNFSGTGAGKTISAILSTRGEKSKICMIVCPNNVIGTWKKEIESVVPKCKVITGSEAFNAREERVPQYLVINYDKLNQSDTYEQIKKLSKLNIDYIILDEIHWAKTFSDDNMSKRRKALIELLKKTKKRNPSSKVLGLSATPVVNNLKEGKSLLELMSGMEYSDLNTKATVPNAAALYEKFTMNSIRQIPQYKNPKINYVDVESDLPPGVSLRDLHRNPLAIEHVLTDARIPHIIKNIKGPTIIYTEYVGRVSFIDSPELSRKLTDAVSSAGYSVAKFTGEDHTGLEKFTNGDVQVLVASKPISTGIDGLQKVCSNLIFNALPWTHAQYKQIVGRIVRTGMKKKNVNITIVRSSICGYEYDVLKLNRLNFKRSLSDCAVDGKLPEKNIVTPQAATREAVKWLERLELGEISIITRNQLYAKLSTDEIKKRNRKYGDFEIANRQINTEKSTTTHKRMLKDPDIWKSYHQQFGDAREKWSVIPVDVCIDRLKRKAPHLTIADFGCGEAKIAETFPGRVKSFDHVAISSKVESCNIAEGTSLKDRSVDIAVFCLSLMGRDWEKQLQEADRCLWPGGTLIVAEHTNQLSGRLENLSDKLEELNYSISKEDDVGQFTFIEAIKN